MGLTDVEIFTLQVVTMTSSALSVSGCSIVLYKLYTSNPIWNLTNKQLLILCIIDLVTAFFWGIGHYWGNDYHLCTLQVDTSSNTSY
jgi:hypothetical protein